MKAIILIVCSFFVLSQVAFADTATSLLIHSNTFSGDTSFEDSSINHHNITVHGDVFHTSNTFVFGGSSLVFAGEDWLSLAYDDAFNFGTDDFTIDFWVNLAVPLEDSFPVRIIGFGSQSSGEYFSVGIGRKTGGLVDKEGGLVLSSNFGSWSNYGSSEMGVIPVNNWVHFALVRKSSVLYFFKNGQLYGTEACNQNLVFTDGITIGKGNQIDGDQGYLDGYIDELRVLRGVAQWTESFEVPTSAYSYECIDGGDFNGDGVVDINDLLAKQADVTEKIKVIQDDFNFWINNCWSGSNLCQ